MEKSIVYTGTGDAGTTSLVGGTRIKKTDIRIEAYGTVDELNSHIGVVDAYAAPYPEVRRMLQFVQHRLFNIGSYLATDQTTFEMPCGITPDDIHRIERMIDTIDSQLPRINRFVLPGGCIASAQCHVARTVCRRAERRIIALSDTAEVSPEVLKYVNRLSDFLFVLGRFFNIKCNHSEIFWNKDC